MRLLKAGAILFALALCVSPVSALPANTHGIDEAVFPYLWADDEDGALDTDANTTTALAGAIDLPFARPLPEVSVWNREEHATLNRTDWRVARIPTNTTTRNTDFIADAFVTAFAIEPSTRVLLSPTERPLYVAPNGSVLALADYRVAIPTSEENVTWRLASTRLAQTRLLVDGQIVDSSRSTTPVLSYTDLPAGPATLTLEATIVAGVSRIENNTTTVERSRLTVREHHSVIVERLNVTGRQAVSSDGTPHLILESTSLWGGVTTESTYLSRWRFFSANKTGWDTFQKRSSEDTQSVRAPHPLQVYAYPTTPPVEWIPQGDRSDPPELPPHVELASVSSPYHPLGALRVDPTSNASVFGFVQGSERSLELSEVPLLEVRESEFQLWSTTTAAGNTAVHARLRDRQTGDPIQARITLAGQQVETNEHGVATLHVPSSTGVVHARYDPPLQSVRNVTYTGTSGTLLLPVETEFLTLAFEFGVAIGVYLFVGVLTGRLVGVRFRGRIW